MSNTPSDEELTACYREANGEMHGKAQPLTTQRIFRAMRAAIVKWGTPQPTTAEFALQALVAAGHVSQELVDKALALPGAPQPVVREPLTEEQVAVACGWAADMGCKPLPLELRIARAIEAAHGIKGVQHGTE